MKNKRIMGLLLGILAFGGAGYAVVTHQIHLRQMERLDQIAHACERTSFQGTLRWSWHSESTPVEYDIKIQHSAPDQTQLERCDAVKGRCRRSRGPWVWARRHILHPVLDPELAASNYSVTSEGPETVAHRSAEKLQVQPIRQGRPSFTVWVDTETQVTLRYEMKNPHGERLAHWEYLTFAVGSPSSAPSEEHGWKQRSRELKEVELRQEPPFPIWLPDAPPSGFRFHQARSMEWKSAKKLWLSYSDGMALISLLQRPVKTPSQSEKPVVSRWKRREGSALQTLLGQTSLLLFSPLSSDELVRMIESMVQISGEPHAKGT